jgi:hypothetical protein
MPPQLPTDPVGEEWIHIGDLRNGRNGSDPPGALLETECVEALNTDLFHSRVGRKRGGAVALSTANSAFDAPVKALYRHVPTSDDSKAELWGQDANGHIGQFANNNWTPRLPIDAFAGGGSALATQWTSIDSKLIIANQFNTDTFGKYRLHLWDGNSVHAIRRAGIGPSLAPPGVVDSATGGAYANTARYYRVRWVEKVYFGSFGQALAVGNVSVTTQTQVTVGANVYTSGFVMSSTGGANSASITVNGNVSVTFYAAGAGGQGGGSNSTFGGSGGGSAASNNSGMSVVLLSGKTYSVYVGAAIGGGVSRNTWLHNDTDSSYVFNFGGGANGVTFSPGGAGGTVVTGTGAAGAAGLASGGGGGTTISYLVVAGGGSGGNNNDAGGGGGGGVLSGTDTIAPGSFPVVVGAGGVSGIPSSGAGPNGGNSTFNGHTAIGGGAGGSGDNGGGSNGGAGGGAAWYVAGGADGGFGTGTGGQGFAGGSGRAGGGPGYAAGGGGGAGGIGATAGAVQSVGGAGGVGIASTISGASKQYAGGGGGAGDVGGGIGGDGSNVTGGTGGGAPGPAPTVGQPNTGGGGGGSGNTAQTGASGGSGAVIVSYPTGTLTCTGGTITVAGANTVHTFTASGTFVITSGTGGAGGAGVTINVAGLANGVYGAGFQGAPAGGVASSLTGPPFDGIIVFSFSPQTFQASLTGGFSTTVNTAVWTPTGALNPAQYLGIGQPVLIDARTYTVTAVNSTTFSSSPNAAATYASATVQPQNSVVVRRSEFSPSTLFTPSGSKTGADVSANTRPVDGETHWELEGSRDDASYYVIGTFPITYPTYVSDVNTYPASGNGTFNVGTAVSDIAGTYNLPSPYKFVAADSNRLLGFGSHDPQQKQNRVWYSMVLGDSVNGGPYPGAVEVVKLGNYFDLDENDSGPATGLVGPFNGVWLAFKMNQIWKITTTGIATAPYAKFPISKKIGALPRTIVVAEDEAGNPCVYFMTVHGPYRYTINPYGINQLEYIGYQVEDLILGNTSTLQMSSTFGVVATRYLNHTIYVRDKRQVWFYVYVNGATEPYVKLVFSLGRGGNSLVSPSPSGWSVHRGPSAQAYASVVFSNTVGVDTSRDLKPYIGQTTANTILKCDTGTTDAGTPYQAYVTSRAYTSGLHRNQVVARCYVLAAAANTTLTLTLTGDAGKQTASFTANLAATATETRVRKRFDDAGMADIGSVSFTLGDAAPVDNAWTLDEFVAEVLPKEIA